MSAFALIPSELLQEIFLQYVGFFQLPSVEKLEGPNLLHRVCRTWAGVSEDMPELWNRMNIFFPYRPKSTRCWLHRSRMLPLTVRLTFHGDGSLVESMQASLAELLIHAERWHTIDFAIPASALSTFQIPKLPRLARFSLSDNLDTGMWTNRFLTDCPSLTHLHLSRTAGRLNLAEVQWSKLQSLSLETADHFPLDLRGCLNILSECDRLESLTLVIGGRNSDFFHRGHTIREPIRLPSLQFMRLSFLRNLMAATTITRFVSGLTLPQLSDLRIRCEVSKAIGNILISMLLSILDRSSERPVLKRLAVHDIDFDPSLLIMSRVLHALEDLTIDGNRCACLHEEVFGMFMEDIEPEYGQDIRLPKLRKLTLTQPLVLDDGDVFRQFVHHICLTHASMERVEMWADSEFLSRANLEQTCCVARATGVEIVVHEVK